jgi:glycerol-3-phosphate acyltransferase PlsY
VTIQFASLILAAYLLGSVPAAYLAAKWSRGIDIRQYGSGNVGASNLLRLNSKGLAVLVTVFDLGKGAVMVWAAQLTGLDIAQQVTVGLAAIVGHNWPVFLRFSGGRGVLTALGVIAILVPWLAPVVLVIAYSFAPFHQLAFGVFLAVTSAPIAVWFFSQPLGVADKLPTLLGFLAMFLIVVIRRLTAPRTPLTDTVPRGQLFINRLLLDRDIRDREAWIHRTLPKASQQENEER